MDTTLVTSRRSRGATRLFTLLESDHGLGFDVETIAAAGDAIGPLVCWQVADEDEAFVVPAAAISPTDHPVVEWLEDPLRRKAIHNAKFESFVLAEIGVRLSGVFDTFEVTKMLLTGIHYSQLAGLGINFSLAGLCDLLLGEQVEKGDLQTSFVLDRPLSAEQVAYAARDPWLALRLAQVLWDWTSRAGLREEALVDSEVACILARMGRSGIPFNGRTLAAWYEQATDEASSAQRRLAAELGFEQDELGRYIDAEQEMKDSPLLRQHLSRVVGTPLTSLSRDRLVLVDHPAVHALLGWRDARTVQQDVVTLLTRASGGDPRVARPKWNTNGASTGRITSSGWNVQAWPAQMRNVIEAPARQQIGTFDYHRQELYILAAVTADTALRDVLRSADPYAALADEIGVSRAAAKQGLLSAAYGIGEKGLAVNLRIDAFDRRDDTPTDFTAVAHSVLGALNAKFPKAMGFSRRPVLRRPPDAGCGLLAKFPDVVEVRGLARRRLARSHDLGHKVRNALGNAPIQSTGAAMIKRALVAADRALPRGKARLLSAVHDEIVVLADDDVVDDVGAAVRQAMGQAAVDLVGDLAPDVSGGWGKTLADAKAV